MNRLLVKFCVFAFSSVLAGCMVRGGYVVKGSILSDQSPIDSGTVYLFNSDMSVTDTVMIEKGRFVFEGKVENPDLFFLMVEGSSAYTQIFLENDSFTILASLDKNLSDAVVSGGENQGIKNKEKQKEREISEKYKFSELNIEFQNLSTTRERKAEIAAIFSKIQGEMIEFQKQLMDENPLSFYTLKYLVKNVDVLPVDETERRLEKFLSSADFTNNGDVEIIITALSQLKLLQPGMQVPDFTIPDLDSVVVKFSDIYQANKITILDFWASWCAPCREVHPQMRSIYKRFKPLGLEIMAVSFDSSKEKWMQAITEDKLPWIHVSDLRYWSSAPRDLYQITYVPQYIIVDSKGIILKRKLSEIEVEQFLEEFLKQEEP
ncbi:MAG: thioredoxin-like domain-containing protein [Bacteroidales bacterium]